MLTAQTNCGQIVRNLPDRLIAYTQTGFVLIGFLLTWRLDTFNLLNEKFRAYVLEQTTFYLQTNDTGDTDPRVIWDADKAYLRGMIISFNSKEKKKQIAKQLELEQKIKQLKEEFYSGDIG